MNKLPQDIVFHTAGGIVLTPYVNGMKDNEHKVIESGVVDSVSISSSLTTKKMPDGNSIYPAHTYATEDNTTADVKLNTYSALIDATLNGYTYSVGASTSQKIETVKEATIIAGQTVSLSDKPPVTDNGALQLWIRGVDGTEYVSTTSTPSIGQYSYNASTSAITFAAADANKPVLINYRYASVDMVEIQPTTPRKMPVFHVLFYGTCESKDEGTLVYRETSFDRATCVSSPKPTYSNDPTGGRTYKLEVLKPRPGFPPFKEAFSTL